MRGLLSILSFFRYEFDKFNNTVARMFDFFFFIRHVKISLKSHFWRKKVKMLSLCTQRCYGHHDVSQKSVNN